MGRRTTASMETTGRPNTTMRSTTSNTVSLYFSCLFLFNLASLLSIRFRLDDSLRRFLSRGVLSRTSIHQNLICYLSKSHGSIKILYYASILAYSINTDICIMPVLTRINIVQLYSHYVVPVLTSWVHCQSSTHTTIIIMHIYSILEVFWYSFNPICKYQ